VLAIEVLLPTPAIRHLIRDNKIHQIYSSMQMGQEKYGMITFNQSLASLYFKRDISLELAMSVSHNPEELQELINRGPQVLSSQFKAVQNAASNAASKAQ
jgi:twitching motility protein PilT